MVLKLTNKLTKVQYNMAMKLKAEARLSAEELSFVNHIIYLWERHDYISKIGSNNLFELYTRNELGNRQ